MCQPPAVDVQRFEDFQHGTHGNGPVQGPEDDIEIFLSGFEAIENAIEEKGVVVEASLEEAEVTAIQLDPEAFAVKVLEPACSQIPPPVVLDPAADGCLAQIAAGLLTFNPFILLGFLFAFGVDARNIHGSNLPAPPVPSVPCIYSTRSMHSSKILLRYRTLLFRNLQVG